MRPSLTTTTALAAALVVCLAGAVDAVLTGAPDQLAVLLLVGLLITVVLGGLGRQRVALPVRRDLVRWLRARAELTGEPPELIADRALAAHRAALDGATPPADRTGR